MPGGRRSWTALDDRGDVVECLRHWIVHLEQTHASPNTIRAYVRHVVDFANFLSANGAGVHEATVPLYDSFLAWRLARRKDALPSPRLVLLRKQAIRVLAPSTRNQIQLAISDSVTLPLAAARGSSGLDYDGVAEFWWEDMEALAKGAGTSAGREAGRLLLEDERRFIDLSRSPIFLSKEQVILE